MNCPNCDSLDTVATRVLVSAGTTRQAGTSVVVGFTNQGSMGMATADHSGIAMTDMARLHRPPDFPARNELPLGCAIILLGLAAVITASFVLQMVLSFKLNHLAEGLGQVAIAWVVLALPGLGLLKYFRSGAAQHASAVAAWQRKMDDHANTWVCQRCGHSWDPRKA